MEPFSRREFYPDPHRLRSVAGETSAGRLTQTAIGFVWLQARLPRVSLPIVPSGSFRTGGCRLSAATFVDVAMEATVAGHGCRLVLRVSAYEWPDEVSGSDANWLTGEVELQAGRTGAFHACHGARAAN